MTREVIAALIQASHEDNEVIVGDLDFNMIGKQGISGNSSATAAPILTEKTVVFSGARSLKGFNSIAN